MRNILLATLLCLLFISTGYSQYIKEIDGRAVYTTREITTVEIIGELEEVLKKVEVESSESPPKARNIKIVEAITRTTPTFNFEDRNRRDVSENWVKIDDYRYSSNIEGKYWVTVEAISGEIIDGEVKIYREVETKIVTIGTQPEPDNPDPDDPDIVPPDETDEFDNLANRVRQASSNLTRNREYAKVLADVANKMANFDIVRSKDAAQEINEKTKDFLPEYSSLLNLLRDDASKRAMGWEQTIRYYREIVRGLQ